MDGFLPLHGQKSCELRDSYLSASIILKLRDSYLSASLRLSWFYLSQWLYKNTGIQLTAELSFSSEYSYFKKKNKKNPYSYLSKVRCLGRNVFSRSFNKPWNFLALLLWLGKKKKLAKKKEEKKKQDTRRSCDILTQTLLSFSGSRLRHLDYEKWKNDIHSLILF